MRLLPAQIAIRLICEQPIPHRESGTLTERLQRGREMFKQMTGKDYGYNLQAWHDHLKETKEGGYTYGRNIVLPKIMQQALESQQWSDAVALLQSNEQDNE